MHKIYSEIMFLSVSIVFWSPVQRQWNVHLQELLSTVSCVYSEMFLYKGYHLLLHGFTFEFFFYKSLTVARYVCRQWNAPLQELLTVATCACRQWQDNDLPAGLSAKGQHIWTRQASLLQNRVCTCIEWCTQHVPACSYEHRTVYT